MGILKSQLPGLFLALYLGPACSTANLTGIGECAGEATPELTAPMPAAMRLQKLVTFAGLTVELFEDVQEVSQLHAKPPTLAMP